MNNQDFQNTYFPLEEARVDAEAAVARVKESVAKALGSDVESIGFAVDRILAEVLELDPATKAGQCSLAPWARDDQETHDERVAFILGSIDKI